MKITKSIDFKDEADYLHLETTRQVPTSVSGAIFSDCKNYRYALWRVWDTENKTRLMFIGLNPSTANAHEDDNTIKKVSKIARNLGYGGVYMLNLFAIISADPTILKTCADPVGENDNALDAFKGIATDVVFAWGNFKEATERAEIVKKMFPNAKALCINKNGSPKHPLYCLDSSTLLPFNQNP